MHNLKPGIYFASADRSSSADFQMNLILPVRFSLKLISFAHFQCLVMLGFLWSVTAFSVSFFILCIIFWTYWPFYKNVTTHRPLPMQWCIKQQIYNIWNWKREDQWVRHWNYYTIAN